MDAFQLVQVLLIAGTVAGGFILLLRYKRQRPGPVWVKENTFVAHTVPPSTKGKLRIMDDRLVKAHMQHLQSKSVWVMDKEELVTECRSRGIPPDGTFKQLRARLRALRYHTAHDSLVEIIFGKDQSIARETALPKDALAPREEQDSAQVFSASAAAEHANYQ